MKNWKEIIDKSENVINELKHNGDILKHRISETKALVKNISKQIEKNNEILLKKS